MSFRYKQGYLAIILAVSIWTAVLITAVLVLIAAWRLVP